MTRRGDADALSPLELDRDDQAATPHRTRLPRGSTAGHAAGASTSGPARRSTISRTRRISSGAPCWGVSGTRSASAPSSRSCSSEATQSRTSRSGTGRAAARRSGRTRSGPSGEAAPGSPGPSMRPTGTSPGAGATCSGPAIARGHSSIRGGGRSATRMPPGASCAAWWTWLSASPSVSRRTRIRRTAERSAGSWGEWCGTDAIDT